jgi:hypothetical protein
MRAARIYMSRRWWSHSVPMCVPLFALATQHPRHKTTPLTYKHFFMDEDRTLLQHYGPFTILFSKVVQPLRLATCQERRREPPSCDHCSSSASLSLEVSLTSPSSSSSSSVSLEPFLAVGYVWIGRVCWRRMMTP